MGMWHDTEIGDHGVFRQRDPGDVDNDRLITASLPNPLSFPTRDLAKSLRDMLPFAMRTRADNRIRLLPTPDFGHDTDPFDLLKSDKSSCKQRRKRHLIIGSTIALALLAVVIYFADVNRSWLAIEDKWRVSAFAG